MPGWLKWSVVCGWVFAALVVVDTARADFTEPPVADTFERAVENPLATGWTRVGTAASSSTAETVYQPPPTNDTRVRATDGSGATTRMVYAYTAVAASAEQSAVVTIDQHPGFTDRFVGVCVRLTVATQTGYCLRAYYGGDTGSAFVVNIVEGSGNTWTVLWAGSVTGNNPAGKRIGLQAVGSEITGYIWNGSAWGVLGSVTDSTLTSGHGGITSSYNVGHVDDFGVDQPPPPPPCSDTIDNDEDGLTDYPADPGCINAGDLTETNATGGAGGGGTSSLVDWFAGGILAVLGAILCLLQNLLATIVAAIILSLNSIIKAVGAVAQKALDALPAMPTMPEVPQWVLDGFGYGQYWFPVGYLLTLFALLALLWLAWFVVAIPLRWAKAAPDA